jgi:CSLREA domain-containing protein
VKRNGEQPQARLVEGRVDAGTQPGSGDTGGKRRRVLRALAHPRRLALAVLALALVLAALTGLTGALAAPSTTFAVTSTADAVDVNVGDGICRTGVNTCTLRAAIQEANASGAADTIDVPAGVYVLGIGGAIVDPVEPTEPAEPLIGCTTVDTGAHEGDHDIACPLTINGAGPGLTIVDGGSPPFGAPPEQTARDRLLEIHAAAGAVTIRGLTLRNGYHPEAGGAVANASQGRVRFENVKVSGSYAVNAGGGIYSGEALEIECPEPCAAGAPRLELVDTQVTGNTAGNEGGGVYVQRGTVAVTRGSISENHAMSGAGLFNAGEVGDTGLPSKADLTGATVSKNVATGAGGGIFGDHEGAISLTNVTLSENTSFDYGGGIAAVSKSGLTIAGGTISKNIAVGDGGGVFVGVEEATTIENVLFSENEAGRTLPNVEVPGEIAEGEGGGGGLFGGGSGPITVTGSDFVGNKTTGEGGGVFIENNGSVEISDGVVRDNVAQLGGGGIENAGRRVNLSHLEIHHNRAVLDGGGIEGNGSGDFTISDSTIHTNTAENGGGFANGADGGTRVQRTAIWNNRAIIGVNDDTGLGGGIYGLGDATAHYENITISANFAAVRGGGFYIDADADVHVDNSTISRNVAPAASGVGDEGTDFNVFIEPSLSVLFRNTIVAGNLLSPNCNFALGSLGGNVEDGDSCHFRGSRDRQHARNLGLDAIADNGGSTMTMALQPTSFAIDGGVTPCPATDARGVERPKNGRCDSGAYEFEGPFGPPDNSPPDTRYVEGPSQDTEETSIFRFTGIDDVTATEDLLFECRLIENDVTEPPEPVDPTEPLDPEFMWLGCPNPWQVKLVEEGLYRFEVRAIDRAGNVDPTPDEYVFGGTEDVTPPNTFFTGTPTNPSSGTTAAFSFSATDNVTPGQWMEYECRIDTGDPEAWLECTSPIAFSNLATGSHTVQVRAADGNDNVDPTPATFTWTVQPPVTCEEANITVFADADAWVDEGNTQENFGIDLELAVRSQAGGEDARTLVRFGIPTGLPQGCPLQSARLRLFAEGEAGRTLQAFPVASAWQEMQANWLNQPATVGTPATTTSGVGYREWDVTSQVGAMIAGTLPSHGFLIRDAVENDAQGAEQSISSRHLVLEPPETQMPQLVLRFDGPETPVPPAPPAAEPRTVACGEVITESTMVLNDLFECPFDGLVIGAPNIELDLNGHTIDGLNYLLTGQEEGLAVGIRNVANKNVHIHNGTVQEFGSGVQLMAGATFNTVEDLVLRTNAIAGVELWDADDGRNGNVVRSNTLIGNGEAGIWLLMGTEGARIVDNVLDGNAGVGIHLLDAHRNTIEGNSISGVVADPSLDSDGGMLLEGASENVIRGNTLAETGDAGVLLQLGSHRNRIEGNTLTRTGDAGVAVEDSDGNEVVDNISHLGSDAGVVLSGANDGLVRDNDVRFNPTGVDLGGSSGNLVEGNDASRSDGTGIAVDGGSFRNRILDNVASDTSADGIGVEGEAVDINGVPLQSLGNLVQGNTTNGNLGDGIGVTGVGHTLRANTANSNAGHGIFAGDDNFDGGGNTASDNGEVQQCVGVVCGAGTPAPSAGPDTTAPDTLFTQTPPSGHGMLTTVAFRFTGTDDVAPPTALRFECRLDAPPDPPLEGPPDLEPPEPGDPDIPDPGNWRECANPVTYYLLTTGEHTFEVRAIDPTENVDLTPATYTWTVAATPPGPDSTPPRTSIFSGPADPTTKTSATIRFGGTDNATEGPYLTYECRRDGQPYAPCTSPMTYTDLSLGAHTFQVRAVDTSGNRDVTPANHSWTVIAPPPDLTKPETAIDSGPDLTTVETVADFTFSGEDPGADADADPVTFECSLDGAAFASCASPATYSGLAVGGHELRVRAVDAAGNRDASPAAYLWTVTAPPVERTVTCGQVLTQSTLVANHLVDCPGDGLVIGAPNITVDLGGHTIDGTALQFSAGVRNSGFDSVTITNGVVQEFDYGVLLNPGTAFGVVSGMTFQLNITAGLQLTNADDGVNGNIVRGNTIAGNDAGIVLADGTQHARLLDNTVSGTAGFGIYLVGASGVRLEGNLITGSSDAGVMLESSRGNTFVDNSIVGAADAALFLMLGSNDNVIRDNRITASEAGVHILDSNRNQVLDNDASAMSDVGVILENAHDTLIRGNDLRFSSGGIELSQSSKNRIVENDASEGAGTGISIGNGSLSNVVERNRANANDAEGIYVGDPATPGTGNLIDRNETMNNIADGIHVGNIGHIVVRNTANHNGGWGIYASQATIAGGNIDGGGNSAIGNVGGGIDPLTLLTWECFNIVCDGSPPLAADVIRPETWITESPTDPSPHSSATFRFGGIDNATQVRYECRLDSTDAGDFEPCTSPATLSGLTLGAHTFQVRSVDFLGNVDASPAARTWTVIAPPPGVAPTVSIVSGPDAATLNTGATFTFSSNEEGASFECRLDAAAFSTCESPRSYAGLSAGSHTFQVRAIDTHGLVSPAVSRTWTITPAPVPTSVTCGRVLTQSTLVTNDLFDCPGNGLVVGAHGITIDLGGHTLDGIESGVGILNNGFDNVAITNGAVNEFVHGVQLNPGTQRNVVSQLTVQRNKEAGLQLSDADDATLRALDVRANIGYGIALLGGTQRALVTESDLNANLRDGVFVQGSGDNRIEHSTISASSEAGVYLENSPRTSIVGNAITGNQGEAVSAEPGSHQTQVVDNVLSTNKAGIRAFESGTHVITGNVIDASDDGIFFEKSNDNVVRSNDVRLNSGGIEVKESSRNRIEMNTVSGNGGPGFAIESSSLSNQLVQNVASGNDGEGIKVADSTSSSNGTLLDRNIANGNGAGGIFTGGGHRLTGNQADFNDGWGIYAQGAIDGGGNNALGNAEQAQCSGVTCTIGINPGAPNTTILDKPANPSSSRNASFTFTGTDDTTPLFDLEFECRLDSTNELAWQECENPQLYSNLSPGTHTFQVRSLDLTEAPDPSPASYTWVYQPLAPGVPPDTVIEIAPPVSTPLFEAVFKFGSNEPDVSFECSLDGAPFTACANDPELVEANWFVVELEFEEEQLGQHTFRVRAVDPEGNRDPSPATHTWTILGALAIVTDGPAFEPGEGPGEPASGGETMDRNAIFEFEANIPDALFECSLDLAVFQPCTSPQTYTNLAVGEHVLMIMAIDPEGEFAQEEPTEYEWTILPSPDQAPPSTTITNAPANLSSEATFEFTGTDDVTASEALVFECRLDSVLEADWFECLSPFNLLDELPEVAPGQHTFDVRAVDLEDNPDPTPARHTWTSVADTIAPQTTLLTTPADPQLLGTEVEFTFTGSDNATSDLSLVFECVVDLGVDGATWEQCESPFQVQGLLPGEHTLQVRTVDLALNADPTPATFTWTVIGPPDTTIHTGPPAAPGETLSPDVTFTFSADQPGSTFACSLNGSSFQPCESPLELTGLGGGAYTLEIQATNTFGLIEEEPAVYEWIVVGGPDTTAPNTSILTGPPATTASTAAALTFVSSELGSAFECALLTPEPEATLNFSSCESPIEYTDLLGGTYEFHVRAIDLAGNVDPTPAVRTWTVSGPPITTITSGPEDGTSSTEATFTFTSSTPGAVFYCALDVPPFEQCTSPVTYTGLSLGNHEFVVFSVANGFTDTEGDGWEWEIVSPVALQTGITAGPSGTSGPDVTIEFAANVSGSTFECSLDGAPFEPCFSPLQLTGLAPGDHTFEVRATDPDGNTDPTPASVTWAVLAADTVPPETTIDSAPPSTTPLPDATFVFSSDEPGSRFECSLDGEPFGDCPSPYLEEGLELGSHAFQVRAIDASGNVDTTPATHEWEIVADTTPPDTEITSGPSGLTGDTVAVFQFAGTDDVTPALELGFECSLDGEPFSGCDSPHELADLTPGEHTFAVRAVDDAEIPNVDPTPATATWTVLNTAPPETSIDSGPDSPTESTSGTFTFSGESPGGFGGTLSFECSLDGADFASCASPAELTGLSVGLHTFEVRAVDEDGNVDATPDLYEWIVVAPIPPDTLIDSGPDDPTPLTIAFFAFSSNQPNVTEFECSLDGAVFEGCESPHEVLDVPLGAHTLEVRAIDEAGRIDPTPAAYTWTVIADPTPLDTAIESGPPEITESASATFVFASEPGISEFECSLDGGNFEDCESPYELQNLDLGPHTLLVRAVDEEGNVDTTPASWSWTVEPDSTPLDTTILDGPPASTRSTSATFIFTSNEAASFECALDGSSFSSCVSPHLVQDLGAGSHTLEVRAKNAAGTFDGTPGTYSWAVEPAPAVTILTGPVSPTESDTATFEFTADVPGTTFECALDEVEIFTPCSSPMTYADLTPFEHEFQVQARVAPDELEPTPASWTWEIGDSTPPLTTIVEGPEALTASTAATFVFEADEPDATFQCSLDGALFVLCASPLELTNLATGAHELEIQASNERLLVDPVPVTWSWTVQAPDTVAPQTTIAQAPPATTTSTSATFTFSATDDRSLAADLELECSLDGEPFESCSSPVDLQDLALGAHAFEVRAVDEAGNVDGTPARHEWMVELPPDTSAPQTTITDVEVDPVLISFEGVDERTAETEIRFECSLDGQAFSSCTSPRTFMELAVGPHRFEVRAIDEAGNTDPSPAAHEWVTAPPPDTTAPETQLTAQPATPTSETSASFSFTGSDAVSAPAALTFECSLDGEAWALCASPKAYAGPLALGAHTFQVRTVDEAGNRDQTPASFGWTIVAPPDTTAPDATIGSAPPATTTSTSASFSFSASESATYQCRLDAAAFAACTSPTAYSGLATGSHTFLVRAIDGAGNVDPSPASHTWTIQAPAPSCGSQVTLTANADAWVDSGSTSSNKGSDSVLKVMSKSGGNLRALVRFPFPALPAGCVVDVATLRLNAASSRTGRTLQALRVAATWSEGSVNWSNQPATTGAAATTASGSGWREWNVAAQVQAMYGASALHGLLVRDATEGQDAEQQFTSREGSSSNRPQLVLRFVASTPVQDTTPPDTAFTSQPADPTTSTSASFGFAGSDNVTSSGSLMFECRMDALDPAPFQACTSPRLYSGLALGSHRFEVRAVDQAGNVDPSPALDTWVVSTTPPSDTTPPETTIDSGPTGTVSSTSATITFSASESGSTFACSLDGAAFAACTSPRSLSGLSTGAHTFQVRATDPAGNTDATPATRSWTVAGGTDCSAAVTVSADIDAWLDQGSSSSNKGTDSILKVMSKSGGNLRAIVRFALPSVPQGCVLDTATLRLYAASSSSGRTLQALRVTGSWTEGGVTWANQPATSGTAATTASGSGWREWAVAAQVQAMYGSGNHGFLIRDAVEGNDNEQQFHAREKGENVPQLVVRFRPA